MSDLSVQTEVLRGTAMELAGVSDAAHALADSHVRAASLCPALGFDEPARAADSFLNSWAYGVRQIAAQAERRDTGERMYRTMSIGLLAAVATGCLVIAGPITAQAKTNPYANCTALHKVYKHGVGKKGAHDLIKGKVVKGKSVTTFKVSTKTYNAAIKANKRLDADHDGVACEQK
jgi:hypothetical protein